MVLSVCRRITGHTHDAEDAYQAAFLVLARRAAVVKPREAVGNWLYGVAVRTAWEARAAAIRRRSREATNCLLPDEGRPDPEPLFPDDRAALDEELSRLPDKYRTLIVLCDLEGESQAALARRFGLAVGTVYSRLSTARTILRDRLRERGFVSGLVLAAASEGSSRGLAAETTEIAIASVSPSPQVAKLAEVVMRTTVRSHWKLVPVVTLLIVTAGLLAGNQPDKPAGSPPAQPIASGAVRAASVQARQPRAGEILVWKEGYAALFRPDGTTVREWNGKEVPEAFAAKLSPDGQTIAVLQASDTREAQVNVPGVNGLQLRGNARWSLYKLTLYPVAEALKGKDYEVPGKSAAFLAWNPDGARVFVGTHDEDGTYETHATKKDLAYYSVDTKTGKHVALKLPEGHHLHDVSADGKQLLTCGPDLKENGWSIFLVPLGVGDPERLTDQPENPYEAAFSPDGKRVLMCGLKSPVSAAGPGPVAPPKEEDVEPWFDTVTLADHKRAKAISLQPREYVMNCRFSPDGKRVVSLRDGPRQANESYPDRKVVVSDVDGKNPKIVFSLDAKERALSVLIDWR
jgi:RNA polymerase sigma factor (sigma-70 family)